MLLVRFVASLSSNKVLCQWSRVAKTLKGKKKQNKLLKENPGTVNTRDKEMAMTRKGEGDIAYFSLEEQRS